MRALTIRRFFLIVDGDKLRRRLLYGPICEARDCRNFGDTCYFPDYSEAHFCWQHKRDNGFCPGCGHFWAGIGTFDFSRTGYCENCERDNFDLDWEEYDDDYSWCEYPDDLDMPLMGLTH
jgi:hypothetical protein